jgi:hypothetical protein
VFRLDPEKLRAIRRTAFWRLCFACALLPMAYATGASGAPIRVWRCHMGGCTWFTVLSKTTVGKGTAGTLVRVAARSGEGPQDGEPRLDRPLRISYVFCSRSIPGFVSKNRNTWVYSPIYPHSVAGVSVGSLTFYFRVCHDTTTNGGYGAPAVAAKLGYQVAEDRSELYLRDPRELLTLTPAKARDLSERTNINRLIAENSALSATTFLANWRKLIGRTVSVAHCTIHGVQPDTGQALCAVFDGGATQIAEIRLRLASSSPPDCSGPKLSVACSVVATGTVLDVGGEAGLAGVTISR